MRIDHAAFDLKSLAPDMRELCKKIERALADVQLWDPATDYIVKAFFQGPIPARDLPARIDFAVAQPGHIGQAFIGPQVPLADDLLNANGTFSEAILERVKTGFDDFLRS